MNNELGLMSQTFQVAFRGTINEFRIKELVEEVIAAIGMTKIFSAKVWNWPDDIGFVYAQPLYESIVTVDGWPRHHGGYMWVCSCRAFDSRKVLDVISEKGFTPIQCDLMEMSLCRTTAQNL